MTHSQVFFIAKQLDKSPLCQPIFIMGRGLNEQTNGSDLGNTCLSQSHLIIDQNNKSTELNQEKTEITKHRNVSGV